MSDKIIKKIDEGYYTRKKINTDKKSSNDIKREIEYLRGLDHRNILKIHDSHCSMNDRIIGLIREGRYGTISLVEHNNLTVVRKVIKIPAGKIDVVKNNIKIFKKIDSHILLIVNDIVLAEEDGLCYIYTEYANGGNLHQLIKKMKEEKRDFTKDEIINYVNDLVDGLKYMHLKEVTHKNLKSSNILVGNCNELLINCSSLILEDESNMLLLYNTTASDIFSLGCIIYEIYTLSMRFKGRSKEEIYKDMMRNERGLKFNRMYGERIPMIEDLIGAMLEKNAYKRMTLDRIEKEVKKMKPPPAPRYTITKNENCVYDSIILNIYLENCLIGYKSLKEISEMNKDDLNDFWISEYRAIFFPSIGQENKEFQEIRNDPPFSKNDANILKKNKEKFVEDLHRLIDTLDHSLYNLIEMIEFLKLIEDYKYAEKLRKEKIELEYNENCDSGDYLFENSNYSCALNFYEIALEKSITNEKRFNCKYKIGLCYYFVKEYELSIEYIQSALELASTDEDRCKCNVVIGKCHYESKEYDKAKNCINEAYKYISNMRNDEDKKELEDMYSKVKNC